MIMICLKIKREKWLRGCVQDWIGLSDYVVFPCECVGPQKIAMYAQPSDGWHLFLMWQQWAMCVAVGWMHPLPFRLFTSFAWRFSGYTHWQPGQKTWHAMAFALHACGNVHFWWLLRTKHGIRVLHLAPLFFRALNTSFLVHRWLLAVTFFVIGYNPTNVHPLTLFFFYLCMPVQTQTQVSDDHSCSNFVRLLFAKKIPGEE